VLLLALFRLARGHCFKSQSPLAGNRFVIVYLFLSMCEYSLSILNIICIVNLLQSSAGPFGYNPPTITSVVPSSGPTVGNLPITISGDSFGTGATVQVTIGGVAWFVKHLIAPIVHSTFSYISPLHIFLEFISQSIRYQSQDFHIARLHATPRPRRCQRCSCHCCAPEGE
jgi:hypothetical protein